MRFADWSKAWNCIGGGAVITPAITGLDVARWKPVSQQIGHGYFLELERFDCGWLPLGDLKRTAHRGRTFYESPAAIGCAFAVHRELYDDLRGFDPHMRSWGVEDLDFSLKCWLLGHPILHDPQAVVAHRFRRGFDNFDVPIQDLITNQLRMAYKNFTPGVWREWTDRCRRRHPGRLPDHPEGLWTRAWQLFEQRRPSAEQERAYLMFRRTRDEFWYAERFNLLWPRLQAERFAPSPAALEALVMASASPSPAPCTASEKKNFYAGARKNVTSCTGSSATITTKKTVLDCEFESGNFADASLAYTGVTRHEATPTFANTLWAQTGYFHWRLDGGTRVFDNRYAEIKSGPNLSDIHKGVQTFPSAGVHSYECRLTPTTGLWEFYYDGTKWYQWPMTAGAPTGWKGKTATRIEFTGEIHHKKTQMPGKVADKCNFTTCRYRTTTGTGINPDLKATTDLWTVAQGVYIAAEWGQELVGTAPIDKVNIWDKKPPFTTA